MFLNLNKEALGCLLTLTEGIALKIFDKRHLYKQMVMEIGYLTLKKLMPF